MSPRTASSVAPAVERESIAGVRFTMAITRTSEARATATALRVGASWPREKAPIRKEKKVVMTAPPVMQSLPPAATQGRSLATCREPYQKASA